MRAFIAISVSVLFALAACGPAAAPSDADAQTGGAAVSDVAPAERAAILSTLGVSGNPAQLENECGEMVTPQFLVADMGPGVGRAVAFVMEGGPSTAACYGDGPLVQLMRSNGGSWREIYQNRGGGLIILPAQHHGGNDIADGGPGFSFPVWEWNGNEYVNAGRQVPDSALSDARFLPN